MSSYEPAGELFKGFELLTRVLSISQVSDYDVAFVGMMVENCSCSKECDSCRCRNVSAIGAAASR